MTIEFHVEKETKFIVLHIQDLNITEKVILFRSKIKANGTVTIDVTHTPHTNIALGKEMQSRQLVLQLKFMEFDYMSIILLTTTTQYRTESTLLLVRLPSQTSHVRAPCSNGNSIMRECEREHILQFPPSPDADIRAPCCESATSKRVGCKFKLNFYFSASVILCGKKNQK